MRFFTIVTLPKRFRFISKLDLSEQNYEKMLRQAFSVFERNNFLFIMVFNFVTAIQYLYILHKPDGFTRMSTRPSNLDINLTVLGDVGFVRLVCTSETFINKIILLKKPCKSKYRYKKRKLNLRSARNHARFRDRILNLQ